MTSNRCFFVPTRRRLREVAFLEVHHGYEKFRSCCGDEVHDVKKLELFGYVLAVYVETTLPPSLVGALSTIEGPLCLSRAKRLPY